MLSKDYMLHQIIWYRLQALDAAKEAAGLRKSWDGPKKMEISFDGKLQLTGNSGAYTNPVMEMGIIHCRALLDFLGLKISSSQKDLWPRDPQTNQDRQRKNDILIEHFKDPSGNPLPKVTPEQAISGDQEPKSKVEKALVGILHTANKGVAHMTRDLTAPHISNLEIVCRVVRKLVEEHLYNKIGKPAPEPGITRVN